jgi:hypothetical protein
MFAATLVFACTALVHPGAGRAKEREGEVFLPVPVPRPRTLRVEPPGSAPPQRPAPEPGPVGSPPQMGPPIPADLQKPAEPGCIDGLKARDVTAVPVTIPPQPDARCTVADPVKLTSLKLADGSKITFPDEPTLACATAGVFAAYLGELLGPLVKGSFGTTVAKISTGPGLECRSRDHVPGAKLSAHGQGLAIDIAGMVLSDGRVISVGAPKTETDRAFEAAARAGGCGYFHTALGPGADEYHKTHWHFDLEPRGSKGDGKFCQ